MFGFLKKKLKDAVDKFSKSAEEESDKSTHEEPTEESIKETQIESSDEAKIEQVVKQPTSAKSKVKKEEPEELDEDIKKDEKVRSPQIKIREKPKEEVVEAHEVVIEPETKASIPEPTNEKIEQPVEEEFEKIDKTSIVKLTKPDSIEPDDEQPKKKSFFSRISEKVGKVTLSEQKFEELFWEIEMALLENSVALEVVEKIKDDLRNDLVDQRISRSNIEQAVFNSIKRSVKELFIEGDSLLSLVKQKKPYVIAIIGINGAGKTTTIAKLCNLFKNNNLDPVVAACDTFRAAAIQQLEEHTTKLGVKLIKHDYGSDPAAVAFDAVEHAKAKNKDVVLIDTAGRLHSNKNLMQELEKILRVAKPDLKIFVGESVAGNDVVEQVELFHEKVGIDGIILAKADVDEKGGAALSVSYVTKKPIYYLGVGQTYDDLIAFDKEMILERLGL